MTIEGNTDFNYIFGLYSPETPLLEVPDIPSRLYCNGLKMARSENAIVVEAKLEGKRGYLYAAIYYTSFENSLGAAQFWI